MDRTATTTSAQIQNLDLRLFLLEERFETNKGNYETLYSGSANLNQQISNQISAATHVVEIISVFLTVLGLILGIFIDRAYRKILRISREIKDTREYIKEHNTLLYERLKRDDTVNLLKRLEEVPEDIVNIVTLLFSRDLLPEDFASLKRSYLAVKGNSQYAEHYLQLHTQHFFFEAITDSELKIPLKDSIDYALVESMFSRDIKNIIENVFRFIEKTSLNDDFTKEVIRKFFKYLSLSSHKKCLDELRSSLHKFKIDTSELKKALVEDSSSSEYIAWLDSWVSSEQPKK